MTKTIPVKIIKEPDDPICPRMSAGGTDAIGYYLVYRGDPLLVLQILDTVTQSLRAVVATGKLSTDEPVVG
jgi:hypothetical protein